MKFISREKRDELATRLLDLANHMIASRDQGHHHVIGVTEDMIADVQAAAVVVRLAPVEPTSRTAADTPSPASQPSARTP